MGKYPYIPNKKMYAAVMGACAWIRKDGYFNRAVRYYADLYKVDPKELAEHIRARQAVGQKGKKRGKYMYYVVAEKIMEKGEISLHDTPFVVKALSAENAVRQGHVDVEMEMRRHLETSEVFIWWDVIGEYETEEEAETALKKIKADAKR